MRPSLRFAALLCVLLTAAPSVQAQSSRLTGFSLLRLDPSARAAALAGAYAPLDAERTQADGMFYNPAFLAATADRQVALGYLNHLADVNAGFAAYVEEVTYLRGTVGVGVRFLSYGEFERTGVDGSADGTFGGSETALTVSYAHALSERLQVGLGVHGAFVSLEDASASAVAGDLGVAYVVPERGLLISASLRNAGVALQSLGAEEDVLPVDLRFSISKRLTYVPLRVTVAGYDLTRFEDENGTALNEIARHLAVSGEFFFGRALTARVGYDHRRHEDLKSGARVDLAGLGAGFGLNLRRFGFDYAYNAWSSFGGLHHLTLHAQL